MMSGQDTIASRFVRLNQLVLGKLNNNIPNKYLAHRDGLLDALFTLYEECSADYMRKDKHIANFADKFKGVMMELKSLRVNVKDFEVRKIIGRGHFGEVQVVREKGTGDVYAMKILRKEEMLSQQNVAFYKEERDIMSKATSPWVTKLQYSFQDINNLYLVMEFLPGGDMLTLLIKYDYSLPEDMCQFYLAELVLAINSLHAMGYVHRDIKPDNILIDRTGHIKLADFGSASQLNPHKQVTSGMIVGTPVYIAPEVLTAMNAGPASSKSYGIECDYWSLGVVSYEMVFGTTPFGNDKVLVTYSNIMNFKNSLKFPPEASEVSESLINMIKGLIQETTNRLGYDQLITHPFFTDIDWNNIRHTAPPYVPTVTSVDDTSNFDEFEPENRPYYGDLKFKKEFSGKNLPFVGFTYTIPFETSVERLSSVDDTSIMSPSFSFCDPETNEKKKKVATLLAQIAQLSNAEELHKAEISKLKVTVESKDHELYKHKEKNTMLEQIIEELNAEVQNNKQLLTYERNHRVITEQKAAQLLKCMKSKQRQDAIRLKSRSIEFNKGEQVKCTLEMQLEDSMARIDEFIKERADLLEELEITKHKLLKCQKKCTEKDQMVSVLSCGDNLDDTMSSDLTRTSYGSESKSGLKMQELRRLVFNLEKKSSQLELDLENAAAEKKETEAEIDALQMNCSKLQIKVAELENEISLNKNQIQVPVVATPSNRNDSESQFFSPLSNSSVFNDSVRNGVPDILQDTAMGQDNSVEKAPKKNGDSPDSGLKSAEGSVYQGIMLKNPSNNENMLPSSLSSANLKEENEMLKTKIESLNTELTKLKEELQNKANQYSTFEKQLREKENELSEAKIDLRISTRKEQQAESSVTLQRQRNVELREKLKSVEESLNERTKTEEELKQQLRKLENELSEKAHEITEKQKLLEIEKAKHEERVKAMHYTCEISKDVTQKFAKSQDHYDEVIKQNMELLKLKEEKIAENSHLLEQMQKLKNDLAKRENEATKMQKVNAAMKSACIELENDFKDLQAIVEVRDRTIFSLKEQESEMKAEFKRLQDDLFKTKSDLKKVEIKSKELVRHIEELTSQLDSSNSLYEAEMQNVQEQLSHYKKVTEDLEEQNVYLQKELALLNKDGKGYTEKILTLESQLCEIKEEAARHITQISSLKTSNLKLTESLEDAVDDNKELKHSYDHLRNELESLKINHCHEKVKLQETVAQQTKLIDFLQSKTENMEKRKRPNIARLFGKKENSSATAQYRDAEKLLETEKSKCRRLQDQLSQLQDRLSQSRSENVILQRELTNFKTMTSTADVPISPMSRAMHCAIANSPTASTDMGSPALVSRELVSRLSKPPGMKHKIPHRFINIMCMRSIKCCACLNSLHFGRPASKCQECSVICHPSCATSLPNTCGLPNGFIEEFKTANENSSSNTSHNEVKISDNEAKISDNEAKISDNEAKISDNEAKISDNEAKISEGWIKIPKKNKLGWDRRYLRILDNALCLFEDDKDENPSKTLIRLDFNPQVSKIVVTSAVSATELPYVASSDLPFVMKLEHSSNTTCWPQRCLYIMASNFSDKQLWVSTLENLAEKNKTEVDSPCKNKLVANVIWTSKGDKIIDPLCTTILNDNILLLGAVDGLYVLDITNKYSCSLKSKINGLQNVYQIACVNSIGLMIMIQGADKWLTLTQLSIVRSAVQRAFNRSLLYKRLSNIRDCHLFAVDSTNHAKTPYLCIAESKLITLFQWDTEKKDFYPLKNIKTEEPCSCIHFTPNSVIFGTDSFYELSLSVFTLKKFLDDKDPSLAGIIYGASQYRSFPIEIFRVSSDDESPEYLMCFHEMGVFVNGNGQRTRAEDMKWSRLPLSFAYRLPYLFITHFNSIEVIEIPPPSATEPGIRDVIRIPAPHCLGPAHEELSIYLSSCHDQVIQLILIDGKSIGSSEFKMIKADSVSITSYSSNSSTKESLPESGLMDFSFSTSMDQSLDDLTSDQTSLFSKTSAESAASSQS